MKNIKGFLSNKFEPVASTYYGWCNYERFALTEDDISWLKSRKSAIEGGVVIGSVFGLYSFLTHNITMAQNATSISILTIGVTVLVSSQILPEFETVGRQDKERKEKLAAFKPPNLQ